MEKVVLVENSHGNLVEVFEKRAKELVMRGEARIIEQAKKVDKEVKKEAKKVEKKLKK